MKVVKCDICGKLLDMEKESTLFEIHSLHKYDQGHSERIDEIVNDICYNCYEKLIIHPTAEKKWENNMIPDDILENILNFYPFIKKEDLENYSKDDHIMDPPRIVEGMGM